MRSSYIFNYAKDETTALVRLAKVPKTRQNPAYLALSVPSDRNELNLLSEKITFAIRAGGHIKKIRAWTTRRAIMFLSARESLLSVPSRPLDSCPLLIRRPLRTKKYPLNIPHLRGSFDAEYLPVSRKVTASQFEKHRVDLHRDNVAVAPCTRSFSLTWRATCRSLTPPRTRPPPSCQILTFQCEGGCARAPPFRNSLSSGRQHIEDASLAREEMRFRHGSELTSNAKNSRGFEIPRPRVSEIFFRVLFRRETWRRYYCLYTALDYRWNM